MNSPLVCVRDVYTRLGDSAVHQGVNLDIRSGEIVAIVGTSGSGKTTLLREMIMLLSPDSGSIKLFDEEVVGVPESHLLPLRRRIGVTFQEGALFSSLSVLENIATPLKEHTNLDDALIEEIASLKLALVGLSRDTAFKYPNQLSGGMAKRVAVARALALDPEILFFDEPTAGLDPVSAEAFDELILRLRDSLGLTVVMVTHDLDILWRATDRVAFLGDGRILADAPIGQVTNLDHPLIRAFFQGPRGRFVQEHSWNQR